MTENTMPFLAHLEELRRRLVRCFIAVIVGFLACYAVNEQLFHILMLPLVNAIPDSPLPKLIYTAPHEAFVTYLKVAFIAGCLVSAPYILYQMWAFVAPGLYTHEKKWFVPVVFFSSLFFLGGALFGYFVVFPFCFKFFASFATDLISPLITTREYLSFASQMLLAFGVIFELPLFAFVLAKIGLINAGMLRRWRRYAIVGIFIVAAILTPPDVVSQCLMAAPLLLLYELSVIIAAVFGKKPAEDNVEAPEAPAPAEDGGAAP